MGSRLLVESPTSITLFASCMFRPLFERCARQLFREVPELRRRDRVSGLGHNQRGRRRAPKLADPARAVIGARPCLRAGRREQERPSAFRRGLTEERSREVGGKREETARSAREQIGSGETGMSRVTDQPPPCPIASSLKLEREHQAGKL